MAIKYCYYAQNAYMHNNKAIVSKERLLISFPMISNDIFSVIKYNPSLANGMLVWMILAEITGKT